MRIIKFLLALWACSYLAAAHADEEQYFPPASAATASSSYATLVPSNAIDGNASTIWSSGAFATVGPYIAVDLGQRFVTRLELVVSMSPNGWVEHDIQVLNNGAWTSAYYFQGSVFDGQTLDIPVYRDASAIRIVTRASPSWVNWNEIRIFQLRPSAPQFVAKMYTEVLGGAPDEDGFNYWTNSIRTYPGGCSADALRAVARVFYGAQPPYSADARTMTLYRGLFSREPDAQGFAYWSSRVAANFTSALEDLMQSSEFNGVAAAACSMTKPGYGFGSRLFPYTGQSDPGAVGVTPPITYPSGQVWNARCDGASPPPANCVQAQLDALGVLDLPANALVRVNGTVKVKGGQVLRTQGAPTPQQYASMARFVRIDEVVTPLIEVSGGGRLESVWVDGGRGSSVSSDAQRGGLVNISVASNTDVADSTRGFYNVVTKVRTDNTAGKSTFFAAGRNNGWVCRGNEYSYNLFTGYSASFQRVNGAATWADGMSINCEDASIHHNQFVDLTDGAVVLFTAIAGGNGIRVNTSQRSQVVSNTIYNTGNGAHWGIVFEPGTGRDSTYDVPRMFDGAHVTGNFLKTSDLAHMTAPLSAGTNFIWQVSAPHPYDYVPGTCNTPFGGEQRDSPQEPCSIFGNTFRGRSPIGVAVNGMSNVTIGTNTIELQPTLPWMLLPSFSCSPRSTPAVPQFCGAPGSSVCPTPSVMATVYEACF